MKCAKCSKEFSPIDVLLIGQTWRRDLDGRDAVFLPVKSGGSRHQTFALRKIQNDSKSELFLEKNQVFSIFIFDWGFLFVLSTQRSLELRIFGETKQ